MRSQHHPLPGNRPEHQRSLLSLHFGAGKSGQKTYIQASLHADEIPGMLVAQHLRTALLQLEAEGKIEGEIVLVPVANPLGLAQAVHGQRFGRFDLASGVNFNRGYRNLAPQLIKLLDGQLGSDAAHNVALVRREALALLEQWQPRNDSDSMKKILQTLAMDADILLDLHCDNDAVLHLYTGTPLADAIEPLACHLQAQAVLIAKESGDDPFDEACASLWWQLADHFGPEIALPPACLSVTVELRGEIDVNHELAAQDAAALLAFLAETGHIRQAAPARPAARCVATPLEGVEPLYAAHAGILVFHKALGQHVEAGEQVAELIEPHSGDTTPVVASVSGLLFARTQYRYVQRGMNLAKIAGSKAWRSGKLLSD